MDEKTGKSAVSTEEREPTPAELANSWLDYRNAEVRKELAQTNDSIKFTRTYQPEAPIRPSYVEPGSMDASDWNVAELEYAQWDDEREEELERLDDKVDGLHDQLSAISDHRQAVAEGTNKTLIATLAAKEIERREKIAEVERQAEERRRIEEELSKGREVEGAVELEKELVTVASVSRGGTVKQYQRGPAGWQVGWRAPKDNMNPRDLFDFDKDNHTVMVRVYSDEGNGMSVEIDDFTHPEPADTPRKYQVDYGNSYWLTVKDGKVYNWGRGRMERAYQYGYPDYHRSRSETEVFGQREFSEVKSIVDELATDLTALS